MSTSGTVCSFSRMEMGETESVFELAERSSNPPASGIKLYILLVTPWSRVSLQRPFSARLFLFLPSAFFVFPQKIPRTFFWCGVSFILSYLNDIGPSPFFFMISTGSWSVLTLKGPVSDCACQFICRFDSISDSAH